MSLKYVYSCNICREEKDKLELIGVWFSGGGNRFTLKDYKSTEGVHVCVSCAKQLRDQLKDMPEERFDSRVQMETYAR